MSGRKKPESSSSSSELRIGDKVVPTTDWTLDVNRDYIDATMFGDMNKIYLAGLREVKGTFTGLLDMKDGATSLFSGDESLTPVSIWVPVELPWWKAWFYRLPGMKWPEYPMVQGDAYVDYQVVGNKFAGVMHFTSGVTLYQPPLTRVQQLRAAWRRLKAGIRRGWHTSPVDDWDAGWDDEDDDKIQGDPYIQELADSLDEYNDW